MDTVKKNKRSSKLVTLVTLVNIKGMFLSKFRNLVYSRIYHFDVLIQ